MAIFKINKTRDYTIMGVYHLKDTNLSLKAKGLLSLMLSLPENWDYSVRGLEKICKETKDTINGIIHELEENGYLIRKRIYVDGKISEWQYDIYECKNLYPKNQDIENQDIGFYDNNIILNNQILNNIYEYYESIYGRTINGIEAQRIESWCKDKSEEEIKQAIKDTATNGVDNVKYVEKMLYNKKQIKEKQRKWWEEDE